MTSKHRYEKEESRALWPIRFWRDCLVAWVLCNALLMGCAGNVYWTFTVDIVRVYFLRKFLHSHSRGWEGDDSSGATITTNMFLSIVTRGDFPFCLVFLSLWKIPMTRSAYTSFASIRSLVVYQVISKLSLSKYYQPMSQPITLIESNTNTRFISQAAEDDRTKRVTRTFSSLLYCLLVPGRWKWIELSDLGSFIHSLIQWNVSRKEHNARWF